MTAGRILSGTAASDGIAIGPAHLLVPPVVVVERQISRDLVPSTLPESLTSWTIPPRHGPRFWIGYRCGSGFPFQAPPRPRGQNAVVQINVLATRNCALSAGFQRIPVIAKGLTVRSFLPSKAANYAYKICRFGLGLACFRGGLAAPQAPVRLGPMLKQRLPPHIP